MSTATATLTVLAAGDTIYVFAAGDDRIGLHSTALHAANLDVERFTIAADRWPHIRPQLLDEGAEIVDCRAE